MRPDRSITLVTVVMSVYNGEQYLVQSIESILNQTFRDFEFIIINDGSTDNTGEIISKHASSDSRIVVVDQENKGLTKSLNVGLRMAKGKYIARQDADDVSLPDRLKRQVELLESDPDYGLVGVKYDEIDETVNVTGPQRVKFVSDDSSVKKVIYRYNPFFHSSVMLRRELVSEVGYYDESFRFAQDYEYWMRVCSKCKAYNIPEVLAYRRNTRGMISSVKKKEQLGYCIRAKLKYIWRLKPADLFYLGKDVLKLMII